MRRVIDAIVDPPPRNERPIWDHFSDSCAYCGIALDRKGRKAHMDHAVADGGNQLGNLVLSCATCNGDEKLAEHWCDFLQRKVPDSQVRAERIDRIKQWIALHPPLKWTPSPAVEEIVRELDAIVEQFGTKCAELRTLIAAERAAASAAQPEGMLRRSDGVVATSAAAAHVQVDRASTRRPSA